MAVCKPASGSLVIGTDYSGLWNNDNSASGFKWVQFEGSSANLKSYLNGNGNCPTIGFGALTRVQRQNGNNSPVSDVWDARASSPTRKFVPAVVVDCAQLNSASGKDYVSPQAFACMELKGPSPAKKSDPLYMTYRGAVSTPGVGCVANYGAPVPNDPSKQLGQPIAALAR
jgi:hypothetical protein